MNKLIVNNYWLSCSPYITHNICYSTRFFPTYPSQNWISRMALFIFLNTKVCIFASCFHGLLCFVISRCFIGRLVIRAVAARTADISDLLTTLLHLYVGTCATLLHCLVDRNAMEDVSSCLACRHDNLLAEVLYSLRKYAIFCVWREILLFATLSYFTNMQYFQMWVLDAHMS